jgi:Zn-dependent protease with chaperone function
MPTPTPRRSTRHVEAAAISAFGPTLVILPFCLVALFLAWLLVRLAWDVPFWLFALGYCVAAVLLFVRPIQALVLTPLFGARRPTVHERRVIEPLWRRVVRMNDLPSERYILRVLPLDEVNAFACGGHLVVVTTFAIEELPEHELAGVLAHELSHHLGMHTVALTIRHWWSLPVVILARVGFWLENVATAATNAFASNSPLMTAIGRVVSALLTVLSWPFLAALYAADAVGNVVGHGSEFQADQRAVRMGYGRNLAAALRRVIALGGGQRSVGWRERVAATHPPARTRVARIEAMLRHPAR